MDKTSKLIDWLVGDREDFSILEDMPVVEMPKMGNNSTQDEPQREICSCSECENMTYCEHLEKEPHQSVKGCSSCAR